MKRYSTKLSSLNWKPETKRNDLEYVAGVVIDDFEEVQDEIKNYIKV